MNAVTCGGATSTSPSTATYIYYCLFIGEKGKLSIFPVVATLTEENRTVFFFFAFVENVRNGHDSLETTPKTSSSAMKWASERERWRKDNAECDIMLYNKLC